MEHQNIYDIEREKLLKEPYRYIKNFMEGVLLHVGEKAFSVLALMPCSLIIPNIPFGSSDIRSNINLIYISPPSSGKSTLATKFENLTYFPLKRRIITAADLSVRAVQMKMLSLIIEDFSQTSEDYETIKVIEGLVGEEQNISKSNMRIELLGTVKGCGLFFGTPHDLERYSKSLDGGLLSRCMILFIYHSVKQHSEIGDYINNKIGEKSHSEDMKLKEQVIIDFYKELQEIQEGKHKSINPIKSYEINSEYKKKVGVIWKRITEKLIEEMGDKYWIRDLSDFYRVLVASAFLNIHNRKYENGILVPNDEDFKIALELMKSNMQYKWAIIKSINISKNIRNPDILFDYLKSGNVPEAVKNILINISPYGQMIKNRLIGSE